jgi:hypothetical protein
VTADGSHITAARPRRPGRPSGITLLGLLVLVGLGAAGCFEVEATLDAHGAGTIDLAYIPEVRHATLDSEKVRFSSAHVTVHSVAPREVGARITASFDDVTKLATAEGFRRVGVARMRRGGEERIRIVIRNPSPKEIDDIEQPGPRIAVTLPGRVIRANRRARIESNRVVWQIPIDEYAREAALSLTARYLVPAGGG